ncbi:MAG: threonine synthase [Phycisphaeraceae bacterium]|nr:threonine synthase [Phycisphaeraceae bacterium]
MLPATPLHARLDLGAGNTPLVHSARIGRAAGLENLFFKLENTNPTGSYKDRFAAVAISQMLAHCQTRCVTSSSGNAGASLAAHCAAAGIECEIGVIVTAPSGKLDQMRAYGANVTRVEGFGIDDEITRQVFRFLTRRAEQPDTALQISAFCWSPLGMAGVKTLSYELAEQSSSPIDHVFSPVSGGGLNLAVARGFQDLVGDGRLSSSPRIDCVQPAGNDTVAGPLRAGAERARPVAWTTQISGLQCASILDGHELISAARASGGTGHLVSDEQIWEAQARLAREEGIFCEPAGATALAGALQACEQGDLEPRARVVCLVTGAAFKDPPSIERMLADDPVATRTLSEMIADP